MFTSIINTFMFTIISKRLVLWRANSYVEKKTNKLEKRVSVFFPRTTTHLRILPSANVTNLCFSFSLGVCHWNLPCKLCGVVSRSRTYPYFPWENPCYDRALTEDPSQQNYVSHFYFLHLIRVSLANIAMPFSPSDVIFLPNSEKFPSRCAG